MNLLPFTSQSNAIAISATATASVAVAMPGVGNSIRVVNEGPNIAFLSIGSGLATVPTGTAALTCIPCPVGDITLGIVSGAGQTISAICRATQTAVLTVQVGEGA